MKYNVLLKIAVCLLLLLALVSCGRSVDASAYDLTRPADEVLRAVKEDDILVHEDLNVTSGKELWDAFYEKTQAGKSAEIVIADYYSRERTIYLAELSFDGSTYTYHSLNGQDGVTGFTHQYAHLLHFNEKRPTESDSNRYVDRYILVNDPNVTLHDIQWGMVSSQMGDYIPHTTVYWGYASP